MACIQPLGLPLRDIVGTGFDHEGTERHRVAKQGWKQGDQSKGDYNVENEFEKDVNPVVIDYDADDEGKEESLISAFSSNAFDLKTYLEETFEVNIKRIFQPSQERFCFVTFENNADATKMCEKKTIELKEKGEETKTLTVKVHAAKYANVKVQKWRIKVREKKAMDLKPHRKDRAGESLGANVFAAKEELNA